MQISLLGFCLLFLLTSSFSGLCFVFAFKKIITENLNSYITNWFIFLKKMKEEEKVICIRPPIFFKKKTKYFPTKQKI